MAGMERYIPAVLFFSSTLNLTELVRLQGILNPDGMDKKRVDVAVRDQKSISGRVWARMVHSMPTRKPPALDADVEAATRLV